MKQYARYDASHVVTGLFELPDDERPDCGDDTYIENHDPFPPGGWPAGPTSTSILKVVNGVLAWVETATLDEIKAARVAAITQARVDADDTYFEFGGKRIAVDEASCKQIYITSSYAALTGQMHPDFPGGWKTIDNSYVAIPNVAAWVNFITALNGAGLAHFNKSQVLKAQIMAATTASAVIAIVW